DGPNESITVLSATNEDGGDVSILPCPLSEANCFETGNFKGWRMRVGTRLTSKPRICAQWRAQYIDSGFGEDLFPTTDPTLVPATFALATSTVSGGDEPFPGWSGFFPLDVDGCVPRYHSPSVRQLTASGGLADVTLT